MKIEAKVISIHLHTSSFEYWLDAKIDEVKDAVDKINNQTESGNFNPELIRNELKFESELKTLHMVKKKYDDLKNLHRFKEFYDKHPDKFAEDYFGMKLCWWQKYIVRAFCRRSDRYRISR